MQIIVQSGSVVVQVLYPHIMLEVQILVKPYSSEYEIFPLSVIRRNMFSVMKNTVPGFYCDSESNMIILWTGYVNVYLLGTFARETNMQNNIFYFFSSNMHSISGLENLAPIVFVHKLEYLSSLKKLSL